MATWDCNDPTHLDPSGKPSEHVHMTPCSHCGAYNVEHTPEDVSRFEREMRDIRRSMLKREEFSESV